MIHYSKTNFSLISQLLTTASIFGIVLTFPAAQGATVTEPIIVLDNSTETLESPSGEITTVTTGGSSPFQIGENGILNAIGDIVVTESYHSTTGANSEIHYSDGALSFNGNPFSGEGSNYDEGGGAVFSNGNITFTGSNGGSLAFDSNKGGSFGGAVFAFGSVTFQGDTTGSLSITNNKVTTGSDGYPGEIMGGAIHSGLTIPGDITVSGTYGSVNISNNVADAEELGATVIAGGAFYAHNGSIDINLTTTNGNVTIADNSVASPNLGVGGAFYAANGFNLTLGENTTLNAHGNKATLGGGFVYTGGTANFNIGAGSIANIGDANSATNGTDSIVANGGLTKKGAGILNLSAGNTYTGGTDVQAGTLRLGATGARILNAVTVSGSATLEGIGTFGSASATHTFASGTTLRAGIVGDFGTLNAQGNITLEAGSILAFNLGDGSGIGYSQLIMDGGNLIVGDGGTTILTLTDTGFSGIMADHFDLIINATVAFDLSLTANGNLLVAEDTSKTVDLGGQDYYLSALGNTVSLVAIPEPSTYGLIGGASFLALAIMRRRQRK